MGLFKKVNCACCGKEFPSVWDKSPFCSARCAVKGPSNVVPMPKRSATIPVARPAQPGTVEPPGDARTSQPPLASPTKIRRAGTLGELLVLVPNQEDVVNQAYLLGYEKGKDQRPVANATKRVLDLEYSRTALLQLARAVRGLADDVQDQLFMELAAAEDALRQTDQRAGDERLTDKVSNYSGRVYSTTTAVESVGLPYILGS